MPKEVAHNLLVLGQRHRRRDDLSRRPGPRALRFVSGHVALMPDAHIGIGATVGSVIPTEGAIIPAAVGVDIGCGMIATETDLTARDLPDTLDADAAGGAKRIPAGVGKGPRGPGRSTGRWRRSGRPYPELDREAGQDGVGPVRHPRDRATTSWRSASTSATGCGRCSAPARAGSRTSSRPGTSPTQEAMKQAAIGLEDPDLAYFTQGTPEFAAYIDDMLWSQAYAMASRSADGRAGAVERAVLGGRARAAGSGRSTATTTSPSARPTTASTLWITRKGAIEADTGDEGVIPGSMGTQSYIVRGKSNADSYHSCSHGASRRMSRGAGEADPDGVVAEEGDGGPDVERRPGVVPGGRAPGAYKSIDRVMADQTDLVTVAAHAAARSSTTRADPRRDGPLGPSGVRPGSSARQEQTASAATAMAPRGAGRRGGVHIGEPVRARAPRRRRATRARRRRRPGRRG